MFKKKKRGCDLNRTSKMGRCVVVDNFGRCMYLYVAILFLHECGPNVFVLPLVQPSGHQGSFV